MPPPSTALSAVSHTLIDAYSSKSLAPGAALVIAAIAPTPRSPICRAVGGSHTKLLAESDSIKVSIFRRFTSGNARGWSEGSTTDIAIGGGAANTLIRIGKASQAVRLSEAVTVDQDSVEKNGDMLAQGAALALSARGQVIHMNTAIQPTFETPFFSSTSLSMLGAINEAPDKRAAAIDGVETNVSGGVLEAGTLVTRVASGVVAASAAADNDAAKLHGVTLEQIADAASGRVGYAGKFAVRFGPGEGVGDHATKEAYLSVTAGLGTLTPPSGAAQVVLSLGVVVDSSAYDDALGGTMEVHFLRSAPRVVV